MRSREVDANMPRRGWKSTLFMAFFIVELIHFASRRKIINHHVAGGTRESHPRVQDLQHPRLGKPLRGLQILDTRIGFPLPSRNVLLILLTIGAGCGFIVKLLPYRAKDQGFELRYHHYYIGDWGISSCQVAIWLNQCLSDVNPQNKPNSIQLLTSSWFTNSRIHAHNLPITSLMLHQFAHSLHLQVPAMQLVSWSLRSLITPL